MTQFNPTDPSTPEGRLQQGLTSLRAALSELDKIHQLCPSPPGAPFVLRGGFEPFWFLGQDGPFEKLQAAITLFQASLDRMELWYRRQEDPDPSQTGLNNPLFKQTGLFPNPQITLPAVHVQVAATTTIGPT